MAAKREPRKTAGNRMAKVLEEELDEDDFYKTTYGGFDEKEGDDEFDADKEDSADEVDSDFDMSEQEDEIISDQDEETIKREEKKKKKAASSKAYKEPKKEKKETSDTTSAEQNIKKPKKAPEKKKKAELTDANQAQIDGPSRKSSRRATAANSYLISMKVKERRIADQKKKETVKKSMVGVRRLTQEELMQEAERTERKNLKSLHNFQRLEASRKKASSKKRTFTEPTIRYFSTSMPDTRQPGKISRNFIVFSEDSVLKKEFHWKKSPRVSRLICPVTSKQARYIDPLTNIPYYDLEAFKLIRQACALAAGKKEKQTK